MHSPPRILIVDDNETNRDILVTRLGVHGYELIQAGDGEECIEVAKKTLPDLILLDVMMPKMSGLDVTRELRANSDTAGTPIILLTAKAQEADVARGFSLGATDYVIKPFSPRDLVNRVQAVLERARPPVSHTFFLTGQ